jgi:tripartite-type tricarboxylate transporter receptor subunit TctC
MPSCPTCRAVREPKLRRLFSWHGILVLAGGAKPIIDKLNRAMAGYLRRPEGITQMKSIGAGAVGSTPQRMAEQIRDESALWIDVIRTANLTMQ